MMKWQSRRIGDFIHRVKDPVTLEDGIEYKQVTIRMNYKGVVLRGFKKGNDIKTKNQWRVRAGLFILSRIDARNGAFGIIPEELEGAIVSNDFLAYEIDQAEVDIEFFNNFLQSPIFLEACIKASRGNTNRKRVNENFFLDYQVELPTLSEQQRLITRINKAKDCIDIVDKEITHQEILLAKLKQAILQEAIQGKLTVDWRKENSDVEPGSQLLERIQQEKQRLIAEKKIRKEKPLPPITSEEIPFKIPDSWEWCRLGNLCEKTGSGSTPRGGKTAYVSSGIPFLRSQNIHNDGVVLDGLVYIPESTHTRMNGTIVYPRDVLLNITGGSIGRSAIVHDEFDEANINQHVSIIRPVERDMGQFIHKVLISSYFQNMIVEVQTGAGREGLPKNKMDRILIPTPSLDEQVAIIERVEALINLCHQLETEIKHSRIHAESLLQAVLKEAFTSNTV